MLFFIKVIKLRLTYKETIKRIMRESGLKFNKSLGQNFLIDDGVLQQIIKHSGINKDCGVIEIGPGIGTLTAALSENAGTVAAIELDRQIAAYLEQAFAAYANVSIIQGDALKLDLGQIIKDDLGGLRACIVANLPYYITTPLIMKFLEDNLDIDSITVMIQKEVADRMVAPPAASDYGALSVAVQYHCTPKIVALVPPDCFLPPPKVTSAVIHLDIKNHKKPSVRDEKKLFRVVKAAFGQRRKTLVNALSSSFTIPKAELATLVGEICGNENVRGETLGLGQFIELSERIY